MYLFYILLFYIAVAAAGMITGFIFMFLAICKYKYKKIRGLFETVSMYCFLIMLAAIVVCIICVVIYGLCEVLK